MKALRRQSIYVYGSLGIMAGTFIIKSYLNNPLSDFKNKGDASLGELSEKARNFYNLAIDLRKGARIFIYIFSTILNSTAGL